MAGIAKQGCRVERIGVQAVQGRLGVILVLVCIRLQKNVWADSYVRGLLGARLPPVPLTCPCHCV